MLDKPLKTCKTCDNPPLKGRRFCLSCIRDQEKEKAMKKKADEKELIKKGKEKEKKDNSIKRLTKQADDLWSIAVKVNYSYRCAYCNKGPNEVTLNSHHLFTRSRNATRWDIDNGICLCAGHHTLSSQFSAHQTGNEFFIWLEGIKGRDWIDSMSRKSLSFCKVTSDLLKTHKEELSKWIEENRD